MQIKSALIKIRGMNQDMAYSVFNPEYSWENKNIRITARDENNLFGITNEKGNINLVFNDLTPTEIITYNYSYLFENYMAEEEPTTYEYLIVFDDYLIEQADGWVPPVTYTYESEFNNYLIEQELI